MKKSKLVNALVLFVISVLVLNQPIALASTKTSSKKVIDAYKKILEGDNYSNMDGGFKPETFNLVDVTGDKIPELIINGEAPQIFTYKDGETHWIYNSWVMGSLYYSKKTKKIMFEYIYDKEKAYDIFEYEDGTQLKPVIYIGYSNKKYYTMDKEWNRKTISKEKYNKLMETNMPKYEKLETPYKNTKANRTKYLKY